MRQQLCRLGQHEFERRGQRKRTTHGHVFVVAVKHKSFVEIRIQRFLDRVRFLSLAFVCAVRCEVNDDVRVRQAVAVL